MASNPAPNRRTKREALQNNIHGELSEETSSSGPLDAGALFVLKSKGSWLHCGYHLTTSIVAPALLSLPLAVAQLGWAAGVMVLLVAAAVTFYSYTMLSLVLEQHAMLGHRLLRFRDMAHHILGHSSRAPEKDYSLPGERRDHFFNAFNAVSIIATTYGNGIIPEIQATIAPPVKGKMFKGLCLCYAVVMCTFFSVAVSGYWAFGSQARSNILFNFTTTDGHALIPKWFIVMTNFFTIVQIFAVTIVYLQPTNELLEVLFADPKKDQYSARNVIPRLLFRSMVVAAGTVIAAMLPFFGDIIAVIGAFGFLPLDFVVPSVMYNITFRPSKKGSVFWINMIVATCSTILTVLGCIATVRQLTLDAKTYKLFANV